MKRSLIILFVFIPLGLVAFSILQVTLLKWIPVRTTPLMIKRIFSAEKQPSPQQTWVGLEDISSNMIRAVIASEDQKFLTHKGFDIEELSRVIEMHQKHGKVLRGCSTISQQTAKNCFTWCSRTWLRKGIEAYYTILIELIWGKRRIIEVYLNVVELGPGIYGVESASQKYYGIHASRISLSRAASIVCCLPNPLRRTPRWTEEHMSARRAQIIKEACYVDIRGLK